ncbi:hypothetical protein LIS90_11930 [Flavobacterium psychrophilum]|uniref:hypothetical protein n=1 Tax=Flavobacterium psychrophilum TaxID=96345 RepID=UPI000B7C4C68|nr:hypothetical protein [Flavobacterium psychrophilum]MCB6231957.1 hypothetical protein [Flavobacterium psychrophilum]SNA85765.1 hypothetical protein FI146_540002 [Flavobacterium psychrophilum]
MEKIQQIVDLLDQHIDDIDYAKSNISKIENEIERKKNNIWRASELEKSIKKNERNVYLEFLYSFIIVGLILYLIL